MTNPTQPRPMKLSEKMRAEFGDAALKRSLTTKEHYDAVEVMMEAFQALKTRVEALEMFGVKYAGALAAVSDLRKRPRCHA